MANICIHLDLYDDLNFDVKVEQGYLGDCDISIASNDKQISFRLTDKQASALLYKLEQEYK